MKLIYDVHKKISNYSEVGGKFEEITGCDAGWHHIMFDFIADALATILDAVKREGHVHGVVPYFILGGGSYLQYA
jgi:hypothetical protein